MCRGRLLEGAWLFPKDGPVLEGRWGSVLNGNWGGRNLSKEETEGRLHGLYKMKGKGGERLQLTFQLALLEEW